MTKPSSTILRMTTMASSVFGELNGCLPVSKTYKRTPSPHQSTLMLYPFARTFSGATYPGVPQNVYVLPDLPSSTCATGEVKRRNDNFKIAEQFELLTH